MAPGQSRLFPNMQLNFPSGTVSPSPLPPPAPLTLTPGVPPLPLWSPKGGAKDPWGSQGMDTSLWGRQCCHWSQLVLTGPTTARHHDDTGGDGRCLAPKTPLCDFWLNRYIWGESGVFSAMGLSASPVGSPGSGHWWVQKTRRKRRREE